MKQSYYTSNKQKVLGLILAVFVLLSVSSVSAQTDTTATATDTTAAPAGPELISPSLDFAVVQKADNSFDLKTRLRGKVNGQAVNFHKLKVSFYQIANGEDIPLGFLITDGRGKAVLNVKADTLKPDAEGKMHFKASFAGNKSMEAVEGLADFKRAKLEITPVKEDSVLSVQVKLTDEGSAASTPVKDATVGIYVQRSFLPLKVGEGTTDENGQATIEFPNGLPGDVNGNLTIIGRVDENETFGNLEASAVQKWGVLVSGKIELEQRALWSTHPPIWMLITFIVLMTTVWGHYIVIVYELFRLRKEEPHTSANTTNS